MPAMIRALHLIGPDAPEDLLEQLPLLAGGDDRVLSIGPPPRAGLALRAIPCPLRLPALAARALGRRVGQVRVVHAWAASCLAPGAWLARRRGAGLVLSLPTAPAGAELDRLRRLLRRHGAVVTVPTEAARETLLAAGLDAGRVFVLPPPAEAPDEAPARRRRTREALGLGGGEMLLAAPAPMVRHAGHKYAAWAHAVVREALPHVHLIVPGRGPELRHVRFFAQATGRAAEVHLTEDRFARADVLAAADVALLLHERDCGLSALAASMAAGLPIVASATPDVAECAPHEAAALLTPPATPQEIAAAILHLADDAELARRLAAEARRRAGERFDPGSARRRLGEIYAAAPGV